MKRGVMKWWRMKDKKYDYEFAEVEYENHDCYFLYWQLDSLADWREGCEKPFHEMMNEEGSDEVGQNEW